MALPDEMRRLSQHFLEAYDGRMASMEGLRREVAGFVKERRAANLRMAAELRAEAGELRAHLEEQESERRGQAAEEARERAQERQRLGSQTAAMLDDFDRAHQETAGQQRRRLAEERDSLASETAAMLTDLGTARQDMADQQRQRLAGDRAGLASDVASMRGELQAEYSGGRRIWRDFSQAMQRRRSRRASGPPPPKRAPRPDDLTTIRGIGPAMERRLKEAGISTFAKLATSTPEQLGQALKETGRRPTMRGWITQARRLAS